MASGFRRIQINTQERAVSADINRLQRFMGTEFAEFARFLLNVGTSEDDPSLITYNTTQDSPVKAEIMNGLMCRPAIGSFNITIDAGLACFINPDGAPDESVYKIIRSDGVSILGQLTITTNASGSTRIDVIECRVNPTELAVSDNRDIFNPSTGLFTAQNVTKELQGQLEFRVRAGTGGGGWPGTVQGWLPLMVASVPAGATSNDQITFWDVRPLVSDRDTISNRQASLPSLDDISGSFIRVSSTSAQLNGRFKARLKGRKIGGTIQRGSPGTDTAFLDIMTAANQSAVIVEPITAYPFVYACFMAGLPRWCRYSDSAAGARFPRGNTGFLLATTQVLPDVLGRPQSAIPVPSSWGFGGLSVQTDEAICIFIAPFGSVGDSLAGRTINALIANRVVQPTVDQVVGAGSSQGVVLAQSAVGGGSTNYNFSFQITEAFWPQNMRAATLFCNSTISLAAGSASILVELMKQFDDTAGTNLLSQSSLIKRPMTSIAGTVMNTSGGAPLRMSRPTRFPSPQIYPRLLTNQVAVNTYGGTTTINNTATLFMLGYEL